MIYVLISICILRFYLARPVIKTNLKQELISYKSDGQGTYMLINLLHITCRADIVFGIMLFWIINTFEFDRMCYRIWTKRIVLVLVLDKVDNDFIIKTLCFLSNISFLLEKSHTCMKCNLLFHRIKNWRDSLCNHKNGHN